MSNFKIVKSEETKKYEVVNKFAVYDLLRSDGSIVINKNLMRAIGVHEAIIYCELLSRNNYFEARGELSEDGYFYNTVDDLEYGTCLSEKQQRNAIKKISALGLIEVKIQGLPAKRYFKIVDDIQLLTKYIAQGKENQQLRQNGGTRTDKMAELDTPKGQRNNTNKIIQKDDYDDGAFSDEESTPPLSYKNNEIIKAISEYMNNLYVQKTGKRHPFLRAEQYRTVYNNIESHCDEWGTDYDGLINMMVQFLNSDIESNWNINHFATEGILLNRMYEVAY